MPDMKDAVGVVRQEVAQKVSNLKALPEMVELLKLHQSLNALEEYLNEPKTTLVALLGLDGVSVSETTRPVATAVRFDEFYGMSTLEAAKAYIKKQKEAPMFQEIVDAV